MIVLSDALVVQRHAQPEKGQQTSRERGTGHQLEHEGGGHERAPLMVRTDSHPSGRSGQDLCCFLSLKGSRISLCPAGADL